MPICAVRTCGERGQFACKKSEGQIISFHRFPSDQYPLIKAEWIRATGQRKTTYSWQPTKESTICSKHFKKEDFLTCTDLKISAVPISEEPLLAEHNEQLQMPSTSSSHEAEVFEQKTDKQFLSEMRKLKAELLNVLIEDSEDNSDTDSADEIKELPQYKQSISNKEFTKEDKEIPIQYEPPTTASPNGQPESNQPITIQDSEPEFSETSSELEFTELDSSETKSSQLSVDAIENPQGSDEPPYGMKISKAYSTRKRPIVQTEDQMKTNIKMYRIIDAVTKAVRPVKSIPKDSLLTDPAKSAVIIRHNKNHPEKPIYLIKKSTASLAGNSQVNQNSSLQFANNTTEIISPETGSSSNRVITLSLHKEEQKKVYSTPVPKLAQINQKVPAKKADILQKIWKATKLNATMETADRVKKQQKLKVNSIIKKISSSDKLSTLASPNVSKPIPTVSRLALAVPRPNISVATSADSMSTLTVSTPTVLSPSTAIHNIYIYPLPIPADSTPAPADSTPSPADSTPTPAYSSPSSADSMTIPSNSTPTKGDSMLTPAEAIPIPVETMPILADSTPSPADSTPTRDDSLAIPADSTPTPSDSMLTSGDSMLTSADSTPPADSMPILADSTLTPTALMPTPVVQKLNDSNIHIPDEYDTFAKHVATQLRQLSLESYLSAQGEIQSVLSKYRLCDLDAIKKKNHDRFVIT